MTLMNIDYETKTIIQDTPVDTRFSDGGSYQIRHIGIAHAGFNYPVDVFEHIDPVTKLKCNIVLVGLDFFKEIVEERNALRQKVANQETEEERED